jgi:hypothetical protein
MADATKRMNYFDRQFLRAKDFQDEQAYQLDRRRRHNQLLHTPGVAQGLLVTAHQSDSTKVVVSTGTAIDAEGREMVLAAPGEITLPTGTTAANVFISYTEAPGDPSTDPGVQGFTRTVESPALAALPTGTPAPPGAVLLAQVPVIDGEVNGAIDNAVRASVSAAIKDGSITEPKLANNAVSTRTISNNAVTATKLQSDAANNANRAVGANHIQDNAVTTAKLANSAVTAQKLQSHPSDSTQRAVGKQHIQTGTVTVTHLSKTEVLNLQVSLVATQQLVIPFDDAAGDAFHLISIAFVGNPPNGSNFSWLRRERIELVGQTLTHRHELILTNGPTACSIRCRVIRLEET